MTPNKKSPKSKNTLGIKTAWAPHVLHHGTWKPSTIVPAHAYKMQASIPAVRQSMAIKTRRCANCVLVSPSMLWVVCCLCFCLSVGQCVRLSACQLSACLFQSACFFSLFFLSSLSFALVFSGFSSIGIRWSKRSECVLLTTTQWAWQFARQNCLIKRSWPTTR